MCESVCEYAGVCCCKSLDVEDLFKSYKSSRLKILYKFNKLHNIYVSVCTCYT